MVIKSFLKRGVVAFSVLLLFSGCANTVNSTKVSDPSLRQKIQENEKLIKSFVEEENNQGKYSTEKIVRKKAKNGKVVDEVFVQVNTSTLEEDLKRNLNKKDVEVKMVKEPPLPIIVPPKVVRILIFPYIDSKGNFHSSGYVFTEIEKSRWVVGDFNSPAGAYNSFTILEK